MPYPKQMATKIMISNYTEFCFKATSVLLSETEQHLDTIWTNNVPEFIDSRSENLVLGKLIHPSSNDGSNIVVSIILSNKGSTGELHFQNILILKARIKKKKLYAYASAFNETVSLTKPLWQKRSDKVQYFVDAVFYNLLELLFL